MKAISSCILLLIISLTFAQNKFERGVIIDSIPVGSLKQELFSLYLPSSFNENKPSPIVFIFEPAARANLGIKPFIKASEKYAFIVVCSNNSKNGPYDKNFKLFNNLFSYIVSTFKIKESEMYLSGFSGGSRLSCAIASISDLFTGVIACGAGFPQVPEYIPNTQKYAYVGICGNRDFNYNEMIVNKDFLNKLNFKNTLITNKNTHQWPNENDILRAFDWLYLQKLKSQHNSEINQKEIMKLYERDYSIILKHIENNELIFAAENYERLLNNYTPFLKVDSLKQKLNKLKKSKSYKQQAKSFSNAFETETEISNRLLAKFDLDIKKPNDSNLEWWKKELKKLKKLETDGDLETKNMVYRTKFNIFATLFSLKKFQLKEASTQQHDFINNLLKLLQPE